MDLSEIRGEVQARGFDYVTPSRIDRWINQRYLRLCRQEPWPFLETSTTVTAPATISDLRAVYSVVDTTNDQPLAFEDIRTIRSRDPGLTATGSPTSWYIWGGQFHVYPASSNSISVYYLRIATALAQDSDEPLIPEEYQYGVLVEGACADAYRDSDNAEMAALCEAEYASAIDDMRNDLLVPNYDGPSDIAITFGSSSDW